MIKQKDGKKWSILNNIVSFYIVWALGKKIQESRLRWFGHVERRDESYIGKRIETMNIEGKRKRGKPKLRWRDKVQGDLREKG